MFGSYSSIYDYHVALRFDTRYISLRRLDDINTNICLFDMGVRFNDFTFSDMMRVNFNQSKQVICCSGHVMDEYM